MSYWVISANVNGAGTAKEWIPVILRDHAAFMGWHGSRGDSARGRGLAKLFAGVKRGDTILIAYGGLDTQRSRRLVACGRVARRGGGGPCPDKRPHKNRIRMEPFVPLDDDPSKDGVAFSGTPYHGTRQPVAIFKIDPTDRRYSRNRALCTWLDTRVGAGGDAGAPAGRVRISSLAADAAEDYTMQTVARTLKADRTEQKLVRDYRDWLRQRRRQDPQVRSYECETGWPICDLYDPERNNLVEAKAAADRALIRMAIGQLFDYQFLHGSPKPRLGLLVPKAPEPGVCRLLESLGIAVVFRRGASFTDSAGGRFT